MLSLFGPTMNNLNRTTNDTYTCLSPKIYCERYMSIERIKKMQKLVRIEKNPRVLEKDVVDSNRNRNDKVKIFRKKLR